MIYLIIKKKKKINIHIRGIITNNMDNMDNIPENTNNNLLVTEDHLEEEMDVDMNSNAESEHSVDSNPNEYMDDERVLVLQEYFYNNISDSHLAPKRLLRVEGDKLEIFNNENLPDLEELPGYYTVNTPLRPRNPDTPDIVMDSLVEIKENMKHVIVSLLQENDIELSIDKIRFIDNRLQQGMKEVDKASMTQILQGVAENKESDYNFGSHDFVFSDVMDLIGSEGLYAAAAIINPVLNPQLLETTSTVIYQQVRDVLEQRGIYNPEGSYSSKELLMFTTGLFRLRRTVVSVFVNTNIFPYNQPFWSEWFHYNQMSSLDYVIPGSNFQDFVNIGRDYLLSYENLPLETVEFAMNFFV